MKTRFTESLGIEYPKSLSNLELENTVDCTSSDLMGPFDPISKRHFSARCFSSLAC